MAIHTLTFDISGSFSGPPPKLSIIYGGTKIGVSYVDTASSTLSFQIDTDKPINHSLLRFYSIKAHGSDGDIVNISNIRIDNTPIDMTAFTHNKGSSSTSSTLSLTRGSYSDYDTSGDITNTAPPPPSTFATINGTAGDDTLYGTDSADTINGLDGNDKIVAKAGIDTVNGGNGNDNISGQDGADILNGDAGDDRIYGGNGADTINGGIGSDRLYGQEGVDTIRGGDNDDFIWGGTEGDFIYGENGNDRLSGEAGNDYIEGGLGADQIFGGAGNDTIYGGDDDDRIIGNDGNDTLNGDAGDDNIDGQYGNDTINGGTGNDTLDGEQGDDIINGDDGNDTIMGGLGADTINGGAGDDIIHGGGISSYDQYVFREGSSYGRSGMWYSEATNSFYAFIDTSVTWNAARSAANSATLGGANGYLVNITSQVENDFIYNMSLNFGVDNSIGASGNRVWLGATDVVTDQEWFWVDGHETGIQFSQGSTALENSYIAWGSGQPNNSGGSQQYATMWFNGGGNNDKWDDRNATDGHNYIIEFSGEDVQADNSINILCGGAGNDLIYGGSAGDTINGDGDNDRLFGLGGNDTINGGAGVDALYGGDGNDILNGGTGADILYGNGGTDTFDFDTLDALDTIKDFNGGAEILDISDIITSFTGTITDHINFTEVSGNTVVSVDADGVGGYTNLVTLEGVTGLDEATMYGNGQIVI